MCAHATYGFSLAQCKNHLLCSAHRRCIVAQCFCCCCGLTRQIYTQTTGCPLYARVRMPLPARAPVRSVCQGRQNILDLSEAGVQEFRRAVLDPLTPVHALTQQSKAWVLLNVLGRENVTSTADAVLDALHAQRRTNWGFFGENVLVTLGLAKARDVALQWVEGMTTFMQPWTWGRWWESPAVRRRCQILFGFTVLYVILIWICSDETSSAAKRKFAAWSVLALVVCLMVCWCERCEGDRSEMTLGRRHWPPFLSAAPRGARRDRTLYADSPPLPPPWKLAGKCRTMGAKGARSKFCLN